MKKSNKKRSEMKISKFTEQLSGKEQSSLPEAGKTNSNKRFIRRRLCRGFVW